MSEYFNFSLDDESYMDGVVPFRILVLAHFEYLPDIEAFLLSTPADVSGSNIDAIIESKNIEIEVDCGNNAFANTLLREYRKNILSIPVKKMRDFSPDCIVKNQECLSGLLKLLDKLIAASKADKVVSVKLSDREARILGIEISLSSKSDIDFFIAEIRYELNYLLNQIIHSPVFQKIEAAWRSVVWLSKEIADYPHASVSILSASKAVLKEDFDMHPSIAETHLYDLIYSAEYGQFGGKPYGLIVTDIMMDNKFEDIKLMENLASICQSAHTPIVAAPAASFFGVESFSMISNYSSLNDYFHSVNFIKWRSFLEKAVSTYVMLALPRMLLRGKCQLEEGSEIQNIFEEDVASDSENCLWCSAAFAFAINCIKSFKSHRLCTELMGDSTSIDYIETVDLCNNKNSNMLVEVVFSELREAELVRLGFTPMSFNKQEKKIRFYSANSVRWGYFNQYYDNDKDTQSLSMVLESQFNFLFIVLRVAQYLKILARGYIGGSHTREEMQVYLNKWLRQYVSDIENPSEEIKMQRPLRSVSLELKKVVESDGFYKAALILRPHRQYSGQHFDLNLDFIVSEKQVENSTQVK